MHLDVRGVEGDWNPIQPQIISADCALLVVGVKYSYAKLRIALSPQDSVHLVLTELKPDTFQYVRMKAVSEISFKEFDRKKINQFRVVAKGPKGIFGEAGSKVAFPSFRNK